MDTATNQPSAEAQQIRELAEAQTAVGFYLAAIKRMLEGTPGPLSERLRGPVDACIGQSERANDAVRRMQRLLLDRHRQSR